MYRGSLTWSRLCSSCSHAKRPKKASPMSNKELWIPGFAYPLWMHPFLKNIVRSPKKALERHQNHCVAVIASNFLSLQVQNCYPFYFNTTAKVSWNRKTGPFLHLLCITLVKKCFTSQVLHWDWLVTCLFSDASSTGITLLSLELAVRALGWNHIFTILRLPQDRLKLQNFIHLGR